VGVAFAGVVAGSSLAGPVPESNLYYGHAYVDMTTRTVSWNRPITPVLTGTDVYSNVASSPEFGISSTDLNAQWGDRVTLTGPGTLDENDFTIYNSGSSAGNLLTVAFVIGFFDGPTFTNLGAYGTVPVDFGTGLPPGYYTFITVTGLSPLAINLPTDVIELQAVTDHTGPADRLGIVSLDPPTIGSSIPQMYINAADIGPAGFYNITGYNANPGYRINVIPPPTPTHSTTWGRIKSLYH
jgi:hypothetical protein